MPEIQARDYDANSRPRFNEWVRVQGVAQPASAPKSVDTELTARAVAPVWVWPALVVVLAVGLAGGYALGRRPEPRPAHLSQGTSFERLAVTHGRQHAAANARPASGTAQSHPGGTATRATRSRQEAGAQPGPASKNDGGQPAVDIGDLGRSSKDHPGRPNR